MRIFPKNEGSEDFICVFDFEGGGITPGSGQWLVSAQFLPLGSFFHWLLNPASACKAYAPAYCATTKG